MTLKVSRRWFMFGAPAIVAASSLMVLPRPLKLIAPSPLVAEPPALAFPAPASGVFTFQASSNARVFSPTLSSYILDRGRPIRLRTNGLQIEAGDLVTVRRTISGWEVASRARPGQPVEVVSGVFGASRKVPVDISPVTRTREEMRRHLARQAEWEAQACAEGDLA